MSDTPMQPATASVTLTGIAAALAASLMLTTALGSVSLASAAPLVSQQTATVITPTVGAIADTGVAPTFTSRTIVTMGPTVGALALGGVAPVLAQQAGSTPQQKNLLTNSAVSGGPVEWFGGPGLLVVVGTFGGGTVQLQMLGPDNATWVNVGAGITQAGSASFSLPDCFIQATISGATNASLTAAAYVIPTQIAGISS